MPTSEKSTVIPTLRYRDAHAAIAFLCDAFGFERRAVYEGDDGRVAHAELVLGGGMIMLGSHPGHGDYDKLVQPPERADSINTQSA